MQPPESSDAHPFATGDDAPARQYRDLAHAVQLRALIVTSLRAQHSHYLVAAQGRRRRRLTFITGTRS
jgi:hypothetical protein